MLRLIGGLPEDVFPELSTLRTVEEHRQEMDTSRERQPVPFECGACVPA